MKKAALAVLTLVILMSVVAIVPVVMANTLRGNQIICMNDYGVPGPHPDHSTETTYWKGTITGDLTGTSYYWESPDNYVIGNVMHFFEDFYIDLGDGWISGYDVGVWNFATFKFRASGWVTDASPNYEYLIGCKFHEEGVTSVPTPPITGIGTFFLGP